MKAELISSPLFWPSVAALAGVAILAFWYPRLGPGAGLPITPKPALITTAANVAEHFGFDTAGQKVVAEPSYSRSLGQYRQQHPEDPNARGASPLSLRVNIGEISVTVDSAGQPLSWRAPKDFKPKRAASVEEVFRYLAAGQASTYSGPLHSAGEERGEEASEWKKPLPFHSEVRERIRVVTRAGVVESAAHRVSVAFDEDNDSGDGETRGYWSVLAGAFGIVCVAGLLCMASIYVIWTVRKSLRHRFSMQLFVAVFLLMLLVRALSSQDLNWFPLLMTALLMGGLAAVGRGISAPAHQKWRTLEQVSWLAPVSKDAGISLASGVFIACLLAAVPYFIAGAGIVPHSWVLPNGLDLVYSNTPLLHTLDIESSAYVIGFFGFAVPAIRRLVRFHWLMLLVLLPAGVLLFGYQPRLITGPMAAPLVAGALRLAIFWIVYWRLDLLAVLSLHFSNGILLTALLLARAGQTPWTCAAAFLFVLAAAHWMQKRGAAESQGDATTTFPQLTGFRAEREKLRAEFSVARRAQQDMLPQNPPPLDGYSLSASCTPSLEVGGDLFDFLKLPGGHIGIGVADVSGKGVPAALYMTLTKGLLSAVSKQNTEPERVMEEVNRHLHGVTRKKVFVTMALGFLDPANRTMRCVRAGHNPVVWRQASRDLTSLISPPGLGLGITASRIFTTQMKVQDLKLEGGDAVVFYSDGITEAMNSALEQFGEQRLMDAVVRTDRLDAEASRNSILREVSEFLDGVHPQDDMTLVVLRVKDDEGERITVRG